MELYINGTKAIKGMDVKTFRGEPAILLDWYEPNTRSGGSGGRVHIQESQSGEKGMYFPSVIGGAFVYENDKKAVAAIESALTSSIDREALKGALNERRVERNQH